MDSQEFVSIRKSLNRTQKQMAQLLGTSAKAVRSYEQGWRRVPGYVERQAFFLIYLKQGLGKGRKPCWDIKKCAPECKTNCPTWEFQAGNLCWFINGTICEGKVQIDWHEKMRICRNCKVFQPVLDTGGGASL